jgi:hypothetical protein
MRQEIAQMIEDDDGAGREPTARRAGVKRKETVVGV